jgi:hypothetical protein
MTMMRMRRTMMMMIVILTSMRCLVIMSQSLFRVSSARGRLAFSLASPTSTLSASSTASWGNPPHARKKRDVTRHTRGETLVTGVPRQK